MSNTDSTSIITSFAPEGGPEIESGGLIDLVWEVEKARENDIARIQLFDGTKTSTLPLDVRSYSTTMNSSTTCLLTATDKNGVVYMLTATVLVKNESLRAADLSITRSIEITG
ncbi:hypothetical protein [Streptomyces sp. NPDC001635]